MSFAPMFIYTFSKVLHQSSNSSRQVQKLLCILLSSKKSTPEERLRVAFSIYGADKSVYPIHLQLVTDKS